MRCSSRLLIIAASVALACNATQLSAGGFVNNRAQWAALSPEARIGYVEALNDSLNHTFVDDTIVAALAKKGRTDCLVSQKITAAKLSELITVAYRNDRLAMLEPTAVYIIKMSDICGEFINQARSSFGLGPQ